MLRSSSATIALCIGLLAGLAGCGGGAATLARVTAQEQEARPTFNVEAAFNNAITDNSTLAFTVEGTANGVPVRGKGQYGQSMLETVSEFDHRGGALRKMTPVQMTLDVNHKQVNVESVAQDFYTRHGLKFLGRLGPGPHQELMEVTRYEGLPGEAQVGSSGVVYTANRYTDASRRTPAGTTEATYTLEPDTGPDSALLVLRVEDLDAEGTPRNTTTTVYRITRSGTARRVTETTADAATNSTLQATFL